MPPEVSIITVYYNTPEEMLSLYRSMQEFLPVGRYEWIIADNQSQQDLSARLPDAVYLRMPENLGFGKGNNRAAEKASARYLFFVNPDCEFRQDCLTPLVDAMKDAAIAGPRVLNPDGSIQLSFGPFLSIRSEALQRFRMRRETSRDVQDWIRRKGRFAPDYVSGCAMMIRTDVFRNLEGFDERFFLYHEDVDLCKRARNQDLRVVYVPLAEILHLRNRSIEKERERVNLEYRKSQLYYYQKHHGWFENLLLKTYLGVSRKG